MKKLQHKIFLLFFALLLILQLTLLLSNYQVMAQQEENQINARLGSAQNIFNNWFENRSYNLAAFAAMASNDLGVKQALVEDTRLFLVALNDHAKRINADLVMAIKGDGIMLGQLINIQNEDGIFETKESALQGSDFPHMNWFTSKKKNEFYLFENIVYQLSFSPLKNGDLIIGWVGFGYAINEVFAKQISNLAGLKAEFVVEQKSKWTLLSDPNLASKAENKNTQKDLTLINQILQGESPSNLLSITYSIGKVDGQQVMAVISGLRLDLLTKIQQGWHEILLLTLITFLLSLGGVYWFSASISRPINLLQQQTKDIINGNYERNLNISNKDELGQLALEFEQMKQAVLSRERRLSYQTYHDPLTDLPNRLELSKKLVQLTKNKQESFVLVRIGPKSLAEVNYSLGHSVGDQIIKTLSERLVRISEPDMLFNVGGCSFVLLVKNVEGLQMEKWLEKIVNITDLYFSLRDISLHIQVQLGIAIYPKDDLDGISLLEKADMALQYAKNNGLQQLFYDSSLSHVISERLQLINELNRAMEADQLILFYQPKLDIKLNIITEVEALIRWQHPTRGMIPPDKFIDLAEKTGHIHQLTQWVLETALRQYVEWKNEHIKLAIAINISAESLKYPEFYDEVVKTLGKYKLTPDAICLEITESVVVDDPKAAIALLDKFRDNGFRLSIDDYGTGYSSLEQLKQLPICEIKIDKAFVLQLTNSEYDQVIVKSTIDMAHAMKLGIVAEGVEDKAALDWLKLNNCEMAQGYFISKPKPGRELTQWLLQSEYFSQSNKLL